MAGTHYWKEPGWRWGLFIGTAFDRDTQVITVLLRLPVRTAWVIVVFVRSFVLRSTGQAIRA
jgi:hypothetical protein